MKHFRNFS
jgi:hypothetical protein